MHGRSKLCPEAGVCRTTGGGVGAIIEEDPRDHHCEANGKLCTQDLSGADFHDPIAAALRNTGDIQGSAFITDPKAGDDVCLPEVTTAQLKGNPNDFVFHA